MSTEDDRPINDAVLKAYLENRDGVSARYQQTAREQPPAGLDAVILKAAHDAVLDKGTQRKVRQGWFALAASLLVGVMVTSSYYELRESGTGVGAVADEAPVLPSSSAPAPAAFAELSQQAAPESAPATAPGVIANASRQRSESALEEIIVTGSRIAAADNAGLDAAKSAEQPREVASAMTVFAPAQEPAYRRSQQAWLEHIVMLAREQEVLAAGLDTVDEVLEAEKTRFIEAWPGVDLDALLEQRE